MDRRGIRTTEFWVAAVAILGQAAEVFGAQISDGQSYAMAGIAAAYFFARTWAKRET